eukprot:jgi/Bigna1/81705/fgenesh1_pg.83_\
MGTNEDTTRVAAERRMAIGAHLRSRGSKVVIIGLLFGIWLCFFSIKLVARDPTDIHEEPSKPSLASGPARHRAASPKLLANANGLQHQKNIVLIVIDDLRVFNPPPGALLPEGGIRTPNLDALAARSIVFNRAYCQGARCGPSRASFLTSRKVDTTRVHGDEYWRELTGDFTTLPQMFRERGYHTEGFGKIFHTFSASGGFDRRRSWSDSQFYYIPPHKRKYTRGWQGTNGTTYQAIKPKEERRDPLPDFETAGEVVRAIERVRNDSRSFFIAAGFYLPHTPLLYPQRYQAFYPKESVNLPNNQHWPLNQPEFAWDSSLGKWDFLNYNSQSRGSGLMPRRHTIGLRQAYYACISFIDEQVGRVVDAIESSGKEKDTIIAVISDHGYMLGEHGVWGKSKPYELVARVPMMMRVPGHTDDGVLTNEYVELLDVMPTLSHLALGSEIEKCPVQKSDKRRAKLCSEGKSLRSLITRPTSPVREYALTQVSRLKPECRRAKRTERLPNNAHKCLRECCVMGYSIITRRTGKELRYTEYVEYNLDGANFSAYYGREMYDHSVDIAENVNVAEEPGRFGEVQLLSRMLREEVCDNDQRCLSAVSIPPPLGTPTTRPSPLPNPGGSTLSPLTKSPTTSLITASPAKLPRTVSASPSLSPPPQCNCSCTASPSSMPSTSPSLSPTTAIPSTSPETGSPTMSPSSSPKTISPSKRPTTSSPHTPWPSSTPSTAFPSSLSPITATPSQSPVTASPSTHCPSVSPSSQNPVVAAATTQSPSCSPVTDGPSLSPTTSSPATSSPSRNPTSTRDPTRCPTSDSPSTRFPSSESPVTTSPSTSMPTKNPTASPTIQLPAVVAEGLTCNGDSIICARGFYGICLEGFYKFSLFGGCHSCSIDPETNSPILINMCSI